MVLLCLVPIKISMKRALLLVHIVLLFRFLSNDITTDIASSSSRSLASF